MYCERKNETSTRWKSRTRGLGGNSHIEVSVLFFKPSPQQVIELLNSFFYNFLTNAAELCSIGCINRQPIVLIVSRLYWPSADCRSQNWVGLRQFNAFVDWIFIAEPRFFKTSTQMGLKNICMRLRISLSSIIPEGINMYPHGVTANF